MTPLSNDKRKHIFNIEGTTILFDVESAKLFRIDAVTEDVLGLWNTTSDVGIYRKLHGRYPKVDIKEAVSEIREMEQMGLLFQKPLQAPRRPENIKFGTRIVTFTLNVIAGCNLHCRYCWNDGGKYAGKSEGKMSRETAIKAIDFLVQHSNENDEITVDFYGGEPFLNFEVIKSTIDYCNEIREKGIRKFDYKITTNGTVMNDEILEFLLSRRLSIGVSLDGPREAHNFNRPYKNGKGSWNDIITNVLRVMDAKEIGVSIKATLSPPNLNKLDTYRFLADMGFYDVEVGFANEACRLFNADSNFVITDEDVGVIKREYLRFAHFYLTELLEKDNATDVAISNNIAKVYYETPKTSPCGAGTNTLCVSGTGDLYPCMGFVGIEEYRLGNIDTGLSTDIFNRFCRQLRGFVFQCEECVDCWSKYLCGGLCPANNVQYNGGLKMPYKKGCDMQRFQNEVIIWLISEILDRKPSMMKQFKPIV